MSGPCSVGECGPDCIKIVSLFFWNKNKIVTFAYIQSCNQPMRVISFAALRNFIDIHADAEQPLREWYKQVNKAYWRNLSDMRKTFRTVDYVGNDRYVFDIKGNHYRIVAFVLFVNQKLYIRFVGTHHEYDRIKDIKNI